MRSPTLAALVLALLGSLVTGCASKPPVWTNPNKDSSEWKTDAAECERFFGGSEKDQLTCMTQRGWRRTK